MSELRNIYNDLSAGTISKTEALNRIKVLKDARRKKTAESLLAVPIWQAVAAEVDRRDAAHHVFVCDLPELTTAGLEAVLPGSTCTVMNVDEGATLAERYSAVAEQCFDGLQTLLRSKLSGKVRVQVVIGDGPEQSLMSGLSGLLKTASLENPAVGGQVIGVPEDMTAERLAEVLASAPADESILNYGPDGWQALRWHEPAVTEAEPSEVFKEQGVYLITGGLGGLGVLFTREILERSAGARIILSGRTALNAERREHLRALGDGVAYRQVDLGEAESVERLVSDVIKEYGQLNGIVHSAGMIADSFLLKKTAEEFRQVLDPKVTGTYNLDRASREVDLDFLVLFSSGASVFGNTGQGDYAAANGFMDRFAGYRNSLVSAGQRRGRTVSINWPLWQDGGMRPDAQTEALVLKLTGMRPLETTAGLRVFYQALQSGADQWLVLPGEVERLRQLLHGGALIESVDEVTEPALAVTVAADSGLEEQTRDYLRKQLSALLKLPTR